MSEEKILNINSLGEKVRWYRKERGYSVAKLSELAGVTISHINNIESANSRASMEVLVRIANALEASLDILLCDSLEMKTSQEARMYEYAKMLEGCSNQEAKVIVDTVQALRKSLRESGI